VAALVVIHVRGDEASVVGQLALLVPFFLAGATLFKYADRIPFNWQLGVTSLALVIALSVSGFGRTLTALPLAYLMIWLGIVAPGWMKNLGSKNDYSYGMYLYGMPVQQVLVSFGAHTLGAPAYTVLCLAATFPFAAGSWFLVERNAMHLRGLVGTRGRRELSTEPAKQHA
jgi:peptidoglycan/LPS O-acetylase OafA/YrhL